jgi:hypothetical protein
MLKPDSTVTISSAGAPIEIDSELFARAASLVNPKSGIANDYLNIFYELLLLVENLPIIPEMIDDVVNWQPVSYRDYFQRSRLPGSSAALAIHQQLSPDLRNAFDGLIGNINSVALAGIDKIQTHRKPNGEIYPEDIIDLCERLSAELKDCLAPTTNLVNNGLLPEDETVQDMVDRLLDGPGEQAIT